MSSAKTASQSLCLLPLISGGLLVVLTCILRTNTYMKKRSPRLLALFLLGTSFIDICATSIRYHPFDSVAWCKAASFFYDVAIFLIVIPFLLRCLRFYLVFVHSKSTAKEGSSRIAYMEATVLHRPRADSAASNVSENDTGDLAYHLRRLKSPDAGLETSSEASSHVSPPADTRVGYLRTVLAYLTRSKEHVWLMIFGSLFSAFLTFDIIFSVVPHPDQRCSETDHTHSVASLIVFACTMAVFVFVVGCFLFLLRRMHDAFSISWELRAVGVMYTTYLCFGVVIFTTDFAFLLIVGCILNFIVQITSGWYPIVSGELQARRRRTMKHRTAIAVGEFTGASSAPLMSDVLSPEWESGADPFIRLLRSPHGLPLFHLFLSLEFSVENLLFWQECQIFVDAPSAQLAKDICDRYLRQHSPVEVNVPGEDRKAVITEVDSWDIDKTMSEENRYTFVKLQRHTFQVMRFDSYPRFREHKLYQKYRAKEKEDEEAVKRAMAAELL
eukprot:ANDGO_06069.mRNA.1 Regulator of G-protein signaling loco